MTPLVCKELNNIRFLRCLRVKNETEMNKTIVYPVKPKRGIKDRLRAGLAKQKPLVVSYARVSPDEMRDLFDAVRRDDLVNPDKSIHAALANELRGAGRHKEADLLETGRFAVDLNGGGKIVKRSPPQRIRVDRNTRGLGYRELREQLDHGRTNTIGPNLVLFDPPSYETGGDEALAAGDIHVHYHGNHVVTMHSNGDHTVFTRGWGHSPSTRAVIQRVTGHPLVQRRGSLLYGPQQVPFQEGSRFNNQGEPVG